MQRAFLPLLAMALMLGQVKVSAQIAAVPPSMNFQGRLARPDGTPVVDGTYSVRFSLWNALSAGTENWNQTIANVAVRNGTFAAQLSGFPANTFHSNQWLEIKIGTDAPLTPRQPLVTVPYAFKADTALTVPDGSLTSAKFAPGVLDSLGWLLGGNSGTNPASHFLGTNDNQPLEVRVNGRRAMRFNYAENPTFAFRSLNVLGGSDRNSIGAGVVGATIAGGGWDSFNGADFPNSVNADFGSIGGGQENLVNGSNATIPGGYDNTASGSYSFAAGFRAKALHQGAFVWADSTLADFASTGDRQFLIRANGGVKLGGTGTTLEFGFGVPGKEVNAGKIGYGTFTSNTLDIVGAGPQDGTRKVKIWAEGGIALTGNIGIGKEPSGYTVDTDGSIRVVNTVYTSDARYKKNIATLENPLDTILNLRGVTFDWDREQWKERGFAEGRQIGFIAQEVEKVLPELVSTDEKGYKSVAYANVVPVLVEAVKSLKRDNDATKKENAELKTLLTDVLQRLEQLESANESARK